MRHALLTASVAFCSIWLSPLKADDGRHLFRLTDDRRTPVKWIVTDSAQASPPPACVTLSPTDRYTAEKGYGYDLLPSPDEKGKNGPFFFSVRVPDGNYRVTVTIGNRKASGNTTVRAESRRLFLKNVMTKKGEFKTFTFTVNKRTPCISGTDSVRIKPRERSKLNWDDKLTFEINGTDPQCVALQIEPDRRATTVFLAGNSTVVDQDEEPWASWGQMIPAFFDRQVCFANYAESGECASTFIAAGRLKKALSQMKPGDYMLIEFGHNDQKLDGPGTGAFYSFATNLKIFIDEVRQRGGYPVLITPTCRRAFSKGRIQSTHADYPDAVRWVARRENVPLIDLQEMTRTLFESMGETGSRKAFVHYPAGTFPRQSRPLADNTHFNPYGAYEIAKCVIEGMKRARLPILVHLRQNDTGFSPGHPDHPDGFHWDDSPFISTEKPDGN